MIGDIKIVDRFLTCKICGKSYNSPVKRVEGHECEIVYDELNADSSYACKCLECRELGY